MLTFAFSPMTLEDREIIDTWGNYPHPFEVLSYATKPPNGWLHTIWDIDSADTLAFAVKRPWTGRIIAFTLLDIDRSKNEGEAYIAMHPQSIAKGRLAYRICTEGIRVAFEELGLKRLHLSLRKTHKVGKKLYEYVGFRIIGETKKVYNNIETDFLVMEMLAEDFSNV